MILNKACFKTKIGTFCYFGWMRVKFRESAALTTNKDWIDDYIAYLCQKNTGLHIGDKRFPELESSIKPTLMRAGRSPVYRPVFLSGTGFEKRVWKEAARVPYGCTCSYGDLASMCGRPGAGRAVGNAIGKNPVMLIVPCHRIIKGDGSLGGFGSGPVLKKELLALEGIEF